MEIYLIRHGECYDNAPEYYDEEKRTMDPPLTPRGEEQAAKLAERLRGIRFDKIYSSDLKRTLQTSEIINTALNTEIIHKTEFREIDMGEVFKKSWDCFPDIYAKWSLHEEDIPYPGGENGAALWNRCKDELFKIAASGYERVAIVTHGGIVRAALCGILGLPQEKRFCFGVPTINCSISILSYYDSKFYIHTFNDYSHIQ